MIVNVVYDPLWIDDKLIGKLQMSQAHDAYIISYIRRLNLFAEVWNCTTNLVIRHNCIVSVGNFELCIIVYCDTWCPSNEYGNEASNDYCKISKISWSSILKCKLHIVKHM